MRKQSESVKMAHEKIDIPKFKGEEDEFCIWFVRAKAYAARFGFGLAMSETAEANLPANQGPGATQDEQEAVERNLKAVTFLTNAMPDALLVNITAAGLKDPNWRTQPKAHLMIAYLKGNFQDTSALAGVGAKRDLEKCTMNKGDNPKLLFEKLVGVKFKHEGNQQANITESDLITQAIQALPSMYTSAVAALIDAERRAGRAVTLEALKQAAFDYFSVAKKGIVHPKEKDIEGGLVTTDEPSKMQGNIKKVIEETIQCTIREFQSNPTGGGYGHNQPNPRTNGPSPVNYQANGGVRYGGPGVGVSHNGQGGAGGMNFGGQGGGMNYGGQGGAMNYGGQGGGMNFGGLGGGMNYGGQGGGVNYGIQGGGMNYGGQGGMNVGVNGGGGQGGFGATVGGMGGGPNFGGQSAAGAMITPEIMLAMIQATKTQTKAPGDTNNMLCFHCGQIGHRSNECHNPKNFELVTQVMMAQGRKPC